VGSGRPFRATRRRTGPARGGLILALAVLVLTAGCGASRAAGGTAAQPAPDTHRQTVTILARNVAGVGTVLVTGNGYALYMFAPDNHRVVTCTGACAGTWPPLMLPVGAALSLGPGVNASLTGSAPDPSGGRVVTYDGWPLYTYTGDVQPGQAIGQNIDLNGGEWYVMRPSGQPLIPQP
jgi:predicted lipoprotein with Yx(FWY)xxD motif